MIKVIGVRFRKAGKVYYFDPAQMEIKMGDHVIVEYSPAAAFSSLFCGKSTRQALPQSKCQ